MKKYERYEEDVPTYLVGISKPITPRERELEHKCNPEHPTDWMEGIGGKRKEMYWGKSDKKCEFLDEGIVTKAEKHDRWRTISSIGCLK